MTLTTLITWLQTNKPNAHWTITGNAQDVQYTDITWLDDPATKPTAQDLGL